MGRKSRWATHSGRLNRRMWLSTWQSERYTMLRLKGLMFGGLACTSVEAKTITLPAGPVGATHPPRSASIVTVSRSSVHSG